MMPLEEENKESQSKKNNNVSMKKISKTVRSWK